MNELIAPSSELTPEKQDIFDRLLAAKGIAAPRVSSTIPRRPTSDHTPLSHAQRRIWAFYQLAPGTIVYHIPFAQRLSGPLHLDRLKKSLDTIARRHEILRTTFPESEGQQIQVIAPAGTIDIPVIDLSGLSSDEREMEAHRLTTEALERPFDLASGPLMRAPLLRLSPEDHILLLIFHQIIYDGTSGGLLVHELAALYAAEESGQPAHLPELSI